MLIPYSVAECTVIPSRTAWKRTEAPGKETVDSWCCTGPSHSPGAVSLPLICEVSMLRAFRVFGRNRVTTLGALLVFSSLTVFVALFILESMGQIRNPYVNIITYLLVPVLLLLGLVIVPFGMLSHARYVKKKGEPVDPYFTFNFNDPKARHRAWFFVGWTAVITLVLAASAYRGNNYMDSAAFCGTTCHYIMQPEYTAYLRSSHARVPCADCHIGPGLPWLFRQKLSGLRQSWHTVTGTYQHPIKTPVEDLRPAREVCEVCHWPKRFYGEVVKYNYSYQPDENNTVELSKVTLHVGHMAAQSSGIHSHVAKQIWYVPKNSQRMEMAWVYERRTDGSVVMWVPEGGKAPQNAGPTSAGARRMDCVDCHNRSAHRFDTFDKLVDDGLTLGTIPKIPWIKKVASETAPAIEGPITFDKQNLVASRLLAIPDTYKSMYPDIYRTHEKEIRQAARILASLYREVAFPAMGVYPGLHTDLQTHDGCFRCHGTLVAATGPNKGMQLPGECNLCHEDPDSGAGGAAKAK
jgi:hypothetical protein